ncbi:MAG: hypothetical protein HC849_07995 [Oscillatoriales cyanobacterium RU_3_3]|nr:hypothetical protein [Oscillatoriales cyanobacterium RU_3_3]
MLLILESDRSYLKGSRRAIALDACWGDRSDKQRIRRAIGLLCAVPFQ